ncbi:LuxR family transcriptional regulator [Streptomyces sp. Ru71]|uniref:helix-turn-helix transcriptional regulator n=1 Tax=Streptomyces sp. Ru71 TaxID=2080746 RepID=UPI0021560C59|nr:LuxR family transcriptional regulator [Streptomyces sp. Ru71]
MRRTLDGEDTRPVLVLVEGPAGHGKSHLVRCLTTAPWAAGTAHEVWTCADGEPPAPPAGDRPLLLVAEDLHRAGQRDLAWLRAVLEGARQGLAAVVTYRPEELPEPGLPLGTPPPHYPSRLSVRRHRLEPWTADEVRRYAGQALGRRCTPEAVARLYERSAGVPQVVADLVEALHDSPGQQWFTPADVDAAGVPVRLADLVRSRTAALPEHHRPVVWAAAVLERPATDTDLLTVAALAPHEGRDALGAALATGLLAETGDGHYRLVCPLAARALQQVLPGPLRKDLHGRAADVLAARQPASWPELARHRRAAGRVRSWLRAVEQAARQAHALGESARYQQAIGLLEEAMASPAVSPQARARLAPVLARSAVDGLRSDQTVEALQRVVRDDTLPAAVRGEIRLDLGLLLVNQVGGQDGRSVLEQAAAELREERPALAARAMCALSSPRWPGTGADAHEKWLRAADRAAADSGDPAASAAVAAARVTLATMRGDPRGWALLDALPTTSTDVQARRHAARGLCNAADAAVWLGHYERAEKLLAEGVELSVTSGSPFTEHTALGARLTLDWMLGRWQGLAERCETFVAATFDMPLISSDGRMVLGLLALAQGEWGRAVSWLSGEHGTAPEYASPSQAAAMSGALIRRELARDAVQNAAAEARTAWEKVVRKGIWAWAAELAPWAVEATARAGRAGEARTMVDAFAEGLDGVDAPGARAALTWSRAALAEATGHPARAVPLYRAASAAYAALGRPYAQALTAEGAGRSALAARDADGADAGVDKEAYEDGSEGPEAYGTGGRAGQGGVHTGEALGRTPSPDGDDGPDNRAIAELTCCIEQFTELGAAWDAARTRALLRAHSPAPQRRPHGRPAYGDQLSPREREVAELAGAGLTNREIAATLHLSPRTVEQHVARAMRKLNLASRQQLAEPIGGG